jgi:hypothetical protein
MKTLVALAFACVAALSYADGCCGKKMTADEKFLAEAHRMMMASEGKTACCSSTAEKPMVKGGTGCCKAKSAKKTAKKASSAPKAAKKA